MPNLSRPVRSMGAPRWTLFRGLHRAPRMGAPPTSVQDREPGGLIPAYVNLRIATRKGLRGLRGHEVEADAHGVSHLQCASALAERCNAEVALPDVEGTGGLEIAAVARDGDGHGEVARRAVQGDAHRGVQIPIGSQELQRIDADRRKMSCIKNIGT